MLLKRTGRQTLESVLGRSTEKTQKQHAEERLKDGKEKCCQIDETQSLDDMATAASLSSSSPGPKNKKLFPENIELNVGGKYYSTSVFTLTRVKDSLLGRIFGGKQNTLDKDANGKYFVDRDGDLFRYILDYLRSLKLHLPEDFKELERLKIEAEYFELNDMRRQLEVYTDGGGLSILDEKYGYISIHVRKTYAFGRSGQADIKFRKLRRILVCGRVSLCREVFGTFLNQTRDPNPHHLRYTNRFFLKYNQLERAFTQLTDAGFRLVTSEGGKTGGEGNDKTEEEKWNHFTSYTFLREKPNITH